jgi:hypothetical protein
MGVGMRRGDFSQQENYFYCLAFPVCLGKGELGVCESLVILLRLLERK